MFKKLLITSLVLTASSFSVAQSDDDSSDSLNLFAQCGIGGMLFPTAPTAAIISNIIWDLGTTATTTAASSPDACAGEDIAMAEFVSETYAELTEETVRGAGDHLSAAINMAGCANQQQATISTLRASFAEQLSNQGYSEQNHQEKAQNYFNALTAAAKSCDLS